MFVSFITLCESTNYRQFSSLGLTLSYKQIEIDPQGQRDSDIVSSASMHNIGAVFYGCSKRRLDFLDEF